ncbi:hypothetical protein CLV51_1033 [Chitinophaga niastensis]|uniref:PA14 domain-containing protein n=1 Tax=Chitinophaga niastensis TaxID=536980 RepID=A0A2P8HII1_CHINA|nr:hypothetical protein [Chitinophaga niastensis]PSL46027.1 hypothetical protein CLV51_1033 [Chitinophaga niastensis]
MIIKSIKIKKTLAFFFLSLLSLETLLPLYSLALTSGPNQPEHKQFAAYSTNDMVDPFTGAFKYNIPVMDVDGYPVNLNYASGVGMDDEASWVGLGWNLNVGAVNRQLRGVPDDFSGDVITTKHYTAPRTTYGGRGMVRLELKGTDVAKLSGSISLGVFSDSYTGMGAEFGVNAGLSLGLGNNGLLTGNLNAGVNSNTSSGVTVSAGLSLDAHVQDAEFVSTGVAANLSYNTREGYKELTLGNTFSIARLSGEVGSIYSYNTPPFHPKIGFGYKSSSQSYALTIGGAGYTVFAGGGLTGYMSKQEVQSEINTNAAYGYLYADRGTNVKEAVMDFMREKENPVIANLPNIALPVVTPDVFSYTNQAGSGQFRLQRGNSGVVFDPNVEDKSSNLSIGADYGFGGYFHGGVQFYDQTVTNTTRKWQNNNLFLSVADYKSDPTKLLEEQAYFKMMNEQTAEDAGYVNSIQGDKLVAVSLTERTALAKLHDKNGNTFIPSGAYKKNGRQIRTSPISYLTVAEALRTSANNSYNSYKFYDSTLKTPPVCGPDIASVISRKDANKKMQHISEITVTESDGKRAVYGLPVYNLHQDEYTFAVNPAYKSTQADIAQNLISMDTLPNGEVMHDYGKDKYYQHEIQPAYASSFLLTSILSPDYVDVTNNGITDDDLGTAVKFNYSKVDGNFGWRTPMAAGKALYNRGLNADPTDDKGSVIYGEKELWYLNSIETKTKIAYFITDDRDDALGVTNFYGQINNNVKQRRLKEIRLYSKSDLTQPIKTAYFEYDYSLCPGVPNNSKGGGKLTLKKVYFTYATSKKGMHHPYQFDYANNQNYALLSSDRWGMFKPGTDNAGGGFGAMRNDEFPYTIQDTAITNNNARKWNLSTITLPTGGSINVEYESGDYAYVQDRRAMQMVSINAMVKDSLGTVTTSMGDAHGFKIAAPGPLRGANDAAILQNFVTDYLNGRNDFYVKMNMNVSDQPYNTSDSYFDNVSCYGEVVKVRDNKDGTYNIIFKDITEGNVTANPFIMAAWQKMRLEYPMYAYPGYEDRIKDASGIERALNAIVNAIGNLSELRKNFNERAQQNNFAVTANLSKSFARVVKGNGIKIGGPARVRKIRMMDAWDVMSGNTAPAAGYGQQYEYRITTGADTISSGVASYEPSIGADENPMRMPVPYSQESKGTLTNYFYLEEPFGESLFPAPQVGYSNVIVRDLDASGNADPLKSTGWIQHEFYTAKDYPVIVAAQARPDVMRKGPSGWSSFSGANQVYELAMSQGYVIWLNDMHGKSKAERVFNQSGAEISSSAYYYKSAALDAGKQQLNNTVATIDEKGNINPAEVIGREIEMITDMREQESKDFGTAIQLGVDVIPFIFGIPLPIPHWPRKDNDNYKLFRSAAVLKTVQQTGILDHVVKTINGSTVTAANLVFDRYTGQPVVTRTNNEYNDPVYSVNLPAYWRYNKMSGAYKNINTVFKQLTTDANGIIAPQFSSLLTGGDEMMDLNNPNNFGKRYWVISSPTANDAVSRVRLIDDGGNLVSNFNGDVKLYRSGYRNQPGASAGTILCLKNPVVANQLAVFSTADGTSYKVTDAKAVLYEEEWGAKMCLSCPSGYTLNPDGTRCELLPVKNMNDTLKVVTGLMNAVYGTSGAVFVMADNSTKTKSNSFWGGNCSGGTSFMAQSASFAASSTPAASVPTDSAGKIAAMKSAAISMNSIVPLVSTVCGRMNQVAIWLNGVAIGYMNTWMGVEACFTAPTAGTYAIGYGADNLLRVYIDDQLVINTPNLGDNVNYYNAWKIVPYTVTTGKHRLRMEFQNISTPMLPDAQNPGAAGLEIYSMSPDALFNISEGLVSNYTVFSSTQFKDTLNTGALNTAPVNSYILDQNGNRRISRYQCVNGATPNICDSPYVCDSRSVIVNPYLTGVLGNWRVSEEKVYEGSRTDQQIFANKGAGLNLRNSGYLPGFRSYWYYDATGVKWDAVPANDKWVTSRYVTLYDKYGQELENKDALFRYSSAVYGYRGAIPVAVGSNSMSRELFYDGFEDYKFNGICGAVSCGDGSFNIYNSLGSTYADYLKSDDAHTGNYCLKLTKSIELVANVHSLEHKPQSGNYLDNDVTGQYIRKLTQGLYPQGFQPMPTKKYVFSAWVKDGSSGGSQPISLYANNQNIPLQVKAVVEGWKQVEGVLDMALITTTSGGLRLLIPASASAAIDDIRIFPYNATIKTYAYDERTLRLMAEMDENNFATFYEYDDEGTLVRVKKETDLGIMTLKETRSVFRKIN